MSQGFLSVPGGGVRGIFLVLVILLCKFKKFELSPGGGGRGGSAHRFVMSLNLVLCLYLHHK